MKRFLILFLFLGLTPLFAQYTEADIYKYIDTYKDMAIMKMYKYKIPASITIAQGVFESACGTSRLATYANNHFGIKCHDWTGDTIHVDDDALGECFRKYNSAEESFTDHSLFLTTRSRYSGLFNLDIMDYQGWAKGLKAAGYATNPKYAERLISLIQRFNIAQLDTLYLQRLESGYFTNPAAFENQQEEIAATEESKTKNKKAIFIPNISDYQPIEYPFTNRTVYENNNTLFVIASEHDTYAKIANDVQRSEKKLLQFNDVTSNKKIVTGEAIYIEKKDKSNASDVHVVCKGETLRYISQKYGITMKALCKINGLNMSSNVKEGHKIKLH